MTCYKYKVKLLAPVQRHTSNQFGLETLELQKAKYLCTPSSLLDGPPYTADEQHYLCYKPKLIAGNKSQGVHSVNDVYFGASVEEVKKPGLFCNPASKDGGLVPHPNDHLKCYKYKVKLPFAPIIDNLDQFGSSALSIQKTKFLCVPTEKD